MGPGCAGSCRSAVSSCSSSIGPVVPLAVMAPKTTGSTRSAPRGAAGPRPLPGSACRWWAPRRDAAPAGDPRGGDQGPDPGDQRAQSCGGDRTRAAPGSARWTRWAHVDQPVRATAPPHRRRRCRARHGGLPATARCPHRVPQCRDRRAHRRSRSAHRPALPPAPRPSRDRPRGRRADLHRLVSPGAMPKRRRVRQPRRDRPHPRARPGRPSATGSTAAATASSTGRSTPSRSSAPTETPTPRPTSNAPRERQDPPRSPPLPQALHRPPSLQAPREPTPTLDVIGGSTRAGRSLRRPARKIQASATSSRRSSLQ